MTNKGLDVASGDQVARPQPGQGVSHTPGPWKADASPVFGEWFVRQDPVDWNGMGYQLICSLPAGKKGSHYGDMFAANSRLIATAPDFYTALRGDPEDPGEISPISWLHSAVEELVQRGPSDDCDDVGAYWMMIDELRGLCERGRLAIAKAEGRQ